MKFYITILFFALLFTGCKKETVKLSVNADEIFWLSNKGADMPVWVKGNTASKIILLFLHGGPGDGAYRYAGFQTNQLWSKYAMAFWDQRDGGAAAGNNNYDNLNLPQMIEDLEKLIVVLKYRYGNDVEIFLMGHSFGGLLGTGFLVKGDNQKNIRGWIEVDGAHDYPATNILSRQMMIDTGLSEIAKGNYMNEWKEIVDYCTVSPPNVSLAISTKTTALAHTAEKYVNINHTVTEVDYTSVSSPLTFGINLFHLYYTSEGKQFLQSLEPITYTDQLQKITIPSLLIWGQYDFTVPPSLGTDALNRLGSSYKHMYLMPHSGHTPMNGDTKLFAQTVIDFVEAVK
ncbi:MAG: alpha/beta hydrolase [Sphingobacteriales bacterium]|nr:alpha/beta hydrolase [Sphingobacteriales bacterium]